MVDDLVLKTREMALQLRTVVLQLDLVLDVKVRAPVTDFSVTAERENAQDRAFELKVDSDALLVVLDEVNCCRRSDVVVRTVCDSCTRLCSCGVTFGEGDGQFGLCEAMNLRRWRANQKR